MHFDPIAQNVKLLGSKCDQMKLFGGETDQSEDKASTKASTAGVKSTFKIEINDEEKKLRDQQQTTVYHTGQQNKAQNLIELDEEDLKEIEKQRLAEIDEAEGGEDDYDEEGDIEDDPDDDLNI